MNIENVSSTHHLKPEEQIKIVQETIARIHNVEVADIISNSRQAGLVRPRHLAIHFCVLAFPDTRDFSQIGKQFNRDRTLVNHVDEKVKKKIMADAKALNLYRVCRRAVEKKLGRTLSKIEFGPEEDGEFKLLIECLGLGGNPNSQKVCGDAIKNMGPDEISEALAKISSFERTLLPFLKKSFREAMLP